MENRTQTSNSLTKVCKCGHDQPLHIGNELACEGFLDDETDCSCEAFEHDGTFYNDAPGDILDAEGRVLNA